MTLPPTLGEVFNSGVVHSGILFTSGHSAPAALAAGRLRAFIAEIIHRGVYSSKTLNYKEVKITTAGGLQQPYVQEMIRSPCSQAAFCIRPRKMERHKKHLLSLIHI